MRRPRMPRRPARNGRPARRALATAAGALGVVVALCGCATAVPAASPQPTAKPSSVAVSGQLRVYAAASLKGAFDELLKQFASDHPGVTTSVDYDGSSVLVTQLIQGAPADVLATADERTMSDAQKGGVIEGGTRLFAANELRLVVPAGNPAKIGSLADLDKPGVRTVLCAPQVPCGAASSTLLADQHVKVAPASQEQNVTAVLAKVVAGEADAGLVYATDAKSAGDKVETITPKGADGVRNRYPIAAIKGGHDTVAREFIGFVLGKRGQAVLAKFGFLAAP